jgi:hypothetical protein
MEAWDLSRYRQPFLAVDQVTKSGAILFLHRGEDCYEVNVSGDEIAIQETWDALRALRSPLNSVWPVVTANGDNRWRPMLTQLDQLGLIEESESSLTATRNREERLILSDTEAAASWLASVAKASGSSSLTKKARGFLKQIARLLRQHGSEEGRLRTSNFHWDVLGRMSLYWQRSAPLSLSAAVLTLGTLLEKLGEDVDRNDMKLGRQSLDRFAGGPFEPSDVRTHLEAMCVLLVLCVGPESGRICTLAPQTARYRTGTNLMVDAEHAVIRALRQLGPCSFHETLQKGITSRELAAGIYLEQFHLSRRFVEIIGPLMHKRTRKGLRELIFRYYAEEVGHEVYEKEAALCLGVSEDDFRRSIPLPLFSAYLDLLTDIAQVNPVGLLVSILITEGFPGTRTPINEALQKAGLAPRSKAVSKHEELNVDLHHSTIARLLLAEVPSVDPTTGHEALCDVVTMVELNFRAWQMLRSYYGSGTQSFPHSWMSVPAKHAMSLFSL